MEKSIITYSSHITYLECGQKYQLSEAGYRLKGYDPEALRIGTGWHSLLEVWHFFYKLENVISKLEESYPFKEDSQESQQEYGRLLGQFLAYAETYPEESFQVDNLERRIEIPLINPDSGRESRSFVYCGKLDGECSDSEGKFLLEHKTTASLDQAYIEGLFSFNSQVSLYSDAIGVDRVLYNVVEKCKLRLKKNQTLEEYIQEVKEWTLQPGKLWRSFLTITPEDKAEARRIMWGVTQKILLDRRQNSWVKNPGACRKWGKPCEYYQYCVSKNNPAVLEMNYEKKQAHSELNSEPAF